MKEMVKLLDNVAGKYEIAESDYTYNGYVIPRVTKILSRCIHNDGLMYWANSLGFKHQSYSKTLKNAANIGSECHNNIDAYIDDNTHEAPDDMNTSARFAYESYIKWFNDICLWASVEIIFHEKPLTCKYFGGTLDGLYKINGKIYLVDYKTSNRISFNYCLQLAAYRYMLRVEYGIEIDGCIILQLSKSSISYNEFVLDFSNINNLNFMNLCEQTFMSLTYSYYNLIAVENYYNSLGWDI